MNNPLLDLTKPFPEKFVHGNPSGGGTYVKHHVVEQRLILALGEPPDFKMIEIIRGDVEGYTTSSNKTYPDLKNVIVGVVCEMNIFLGIGEWPGDTTVQEAGDCEQPHNWKTDGQRLKDAMSDAYKRCAMRLGCGLHLWSQDEFFLHDQLTIRANQEPEVVPTEGTPTSGAAQSSGSELSGVGSDGPKTERAARSEGKASGERGSSGAATTAETLPAESTTGPSPTPEPWSDEEMQEGIA